MRKDKKLRNSRREFLFKSFSSCAFGCLAISGTYSINKIPFIQTQGDKHKFQSDSGMTLQDVYNFAYKEWYIPVMKNLASQIGQEKLLELLKKSSEKLQEPAKNRDIDYTERTLKRWSENIKKGCENWKDRLTSEILIDDKDNFEIKITECLWAKTFREADAADIGYAGVCYQDYPMTNAFNPNLILVREKTLMEGQDYCHFKWSMKD